MYKFAAASADESIVSGLVFLEAQRSKSVRRAIDELRYISRKNVYQPESDLTITMAEAPNRLKLAQEHYDSTIL